MRKYRASLQDLIQMERGVASCIGIYEVVDFKKEDPESAFLCFKCALRIRR